jgi:hypothetical protein
MEELEVGDSLKIDESTGFLKKDGDSDIEFKVVQKYNLADGQAAVKLQRIA